MIDVSLTMLAFTFRSTALVGCLILASFFARATGPMVRPFQDLFLALSFAWAWVMVTSTATLVGYIDKAHDLADLSITWIFIPHLVVTVALVRLIYYLQQGTRKKRT